MGNVDQYPVYFTVFKDLRPCSMYGIACWLFDFAADTDFDLRQRNDLTRFGD